MAALVARLLSCLAGKAISRAGLGGAVERAQAARHSNVSKKPFRVYVTITGRLQINCRRGSYLYGE